MRKRRNGMKTIGLLGGMSWESSKEYYRLINEEVRRRLGGLHSAQCLMYSVDFAPIEALQHTEDWDLLTSLMIDAAGRLERGGAEFLVICTNTMHKLVDEMKTALYIPILHIADATAAAIRLRGLDTVGLLGTRFTMEEDFYAGRLTEEHSLKVIVPEERGREKVHRIIYEELVKGEIRDVSRQIYLEVINDLHDRGAQGVILGCTEIGLLVNQKDVTLPVFDTTAIHAEAAVALALEEE
jgi:aspartate racemase